MCVCVYILLAYGSSWLGVYVNVCMHMELNLELATILFALVWDATLDSIFDYREYS